MESKHYKVVVHYNETNRTPPLPGKAHHAIHGYIKGTLNDAQSYEKALVQQVTQNKTNQVVTTTIEER